MYHSVGVVIQPGEAVPITLVTDGQPLLRLDGGISGGVAIQLSSSLRAPEALEFADALAVAVEQFHAAVYAQHAEDTKPIPVQR